MTCIHEKVDTEGCQSITDQKKTIYISVPIFVYDYMNMGKY